MFPPIKYKVHPKMLEIQEQKRKRREMLEEARFKQSEQRQQLKQGREQYIKENKQAISNKQQAIYERKLVQRNRIRAQDQQRAQKIALKKSERLMKLIPQRRQLIQNLRTNYVESIKSKDKEKQQNIKKIIQQQIMQEQKKRQQDPKLQEKIKNNNILDTNEGICVICLVSQASIFMVKCKHLIACKECQFIIRLNKKCPLCRKVSEYQNLLDKKKRKGK